ncbi:MAG TPA: polyprenyl diphosphate synthase [Gemmatimonadaceae bacterium]|jgi:undecaprenyl diphosphate synthase|nr:polyprenyl diphosphate synthase [Gemmatimonadaceae bacterium]
MTPPAASARAPQHVAIIMDGNGRWATRRAMPRTAGHRAGVRTARTIVETARDAGVRTLTLYAFSADNWRRPRVEVTALMRLFRRSLLAESRRCLENGVKLTVIGRRDRLPAFLVGTIDEAESLTAGCSDMLLRIAVDYSARDALLRAAALVAGAPVSREEFATLLAKVDHGCGAPGDVDLLIRTGGEQRLSDFLLWECAYAELAFTPRMWPDFSADDFRQMLAEFGTRERRFGGVPEQVAS